MSETRNIPMEQETVRGKDGKSRKLFAVFAYPDRGNPKENEAAKILTLNQRYPVASVIIDKMNSICQLVGDKTWFNVLQFTFADENNISVDVFEHKEFEHYFCLT